MPATTVCVYCSSGKDKVNRSINGFPNNLWISPLQASFLYIRFNTVLCFCNRMVSFPQSGSEFHHMGITFYMTPATNSINLLFILFHLCHFYRSLFNRVPTDASILQTITVHSSLSHSHTQTHSLPCSVCSYSPTKLIWVQTRDSWREEIRDKTHLQCSYTQSMEKFCIKSSESWFYL